MTGQRWTFSRLSFSLQDSDYVIAERNFVTEDHSMLRFHKGDIIRLQVMDGLEKGETPCGQIPCMFWLNPWLRSEPLGTCRSFRFQLRLCGEKDGRVFGGNEKRYFGLWWGLVGSLCWCFFIFKRPCGQRIIRSCKKMWFRVSVLLSMSKKNTIFKCWAWA